MLVCKEYLIHLQVLQHILVQRVLLHKNLDFAVTLRFGEAERAQFLLTLDDKKMVNM